MKEMRMKKKKQKDKEQRRELINKGREIQKKVDMIQMKKKEKKEKSKYNAPKNSQPKKPAPKPKPAPKKKPAPKTSKLGGVKTDNKGKVKVWTGSGRLPDNTMTKDKQKFMKAWRSQGFKVADLERKK